MVAVYLGLCFSVLHAAPHKTEISDEAIIAAVKTFLDQVPATVKVIRKSREISYLHKEKKFYAVHGRRTERAEQSVYETAPQVSRVLSDHDLMGKIALLAGKLKGFRVIVVALSATQRVTNPDVFLGMHRNRGVVVKHLGSLQTQMPLRENRYGARGLRFLGSTVHDYSEDSDVRSHTTVEIDPNNKSTISSIHLVRLSRKTPFDPHDQLLWTPQGVSLARSDKTEALDVPWTAQDLSTRPDNFDSMMLVDEFREKSKRLAAEKRESYQRTAVTNRWAPKREVTAKIRNFLLRLPVRNVELSIKNSDGLHAGLSGPVTLYKAKNIDSNGPPGVEVRYFDGKPVVEPSIVDAGRPKAFSTQRELHWALADLIRALGPGTQLIVELAKPKLFFGKWTAPNKIVVADGHIMDFTQNIILGLSDALRQTTFDATTLEVKKDQEQRHSLRKASGGHAHRWLLVHRVDEADQRHWEKTDIKAMKQVEDGSSSGRIVDVASLRISKSEVTLGTKKAEIELDEPTLKSESGASALLEASAYFRSGRINQAFARLRKVAKPSRTRNR